MHVDYKVALDQGKKLELVHDARHALLSYYTSLCHLFHSKLFLVLLRRDTPDFPEPTSSDGVYLLEIRLARLCRAVFVLLRFEVAVSHVS